MPKKTHHSIARCALKTRMLHSPKTMFLLKQQVFEILFRICVLITCANAKCRAFVGEVLTIGYS